MSLSSSLSFFFQRTCVNDSLLHAASDAAARSNHFRMWEYLPQRQQPNNRWSDYFLIVTSNCKTDQIQVKYHQATTQRKAIMRAGSNPAIYFLWPGVRALILRYLSAWMQVENESFLRTHLSYWMVDYIEPCLVICTIITACKLHEHHTFFKFHNVWFSNEFLFIALFICSLSCLKSMRWDFETLTSSISRAVSGLL